MMQGILGMLGAERGVFVVIRCIHGLIEQQCCICQRPAKILPPEKEHNEIKKRSKTKTKKTGD
jgi:hypothetical protein